jgi:biopolymer transport protein ExbD
MEDVGFQMAPMIDIVFQLMIFFMCASHLHITLDNPQIDIPLATNSTIPEELDERRYITIKVDGTILLGGAVVTLDQVKAEITKATKQKPDIRIFLRADAQLRHKSVREVMQACADGGASDIIFAAYQSETL